MTLLLPYILTYIVILSRACLSAEVTLKFDFKLAIDIGDCGDMDNETETNFMKLVSNLLNSQFNTVISDVNTTQFNTVISDVNTTLCQEDDYCDGTSCKNKPHLYMTSIVTIPCRVNTSVLQKGLLFFGHALNETEYSNGLTTKEDKTERPLVIYTNITCCSSGCNSLKCSDILTYIVILSRACLSAEVTLKFDFKLAIDIGDCGDMDNETETNFMKLVSNLLNSQFNTVISDVNTTLCQEDDYCDGTSCKHKPHLYMTSIVTIPCRVNTSVLQKGLLFFGHALNETECSNGLTTKEDKTERLLVIYTNITCCSSGCKSLKCSDFTAHISTVGHICPSSEITLTFDFKLAIDSPSCNDTGDEVKAKHVHLVSNLLRAQLNRSVSTPYNRTCRNEKYCNGVKCTDKAYLSMSTNVSLPCSTNASSLDGSLQLFRRPLNETEYRKGLLSNNDETSQARPLVIYTKFACNSSFCFQKCSGLSTTWQTDGYISSTTPKSAHADTTHSMGTGGIASNVQSTSNLSKTSVSDTGRTGATDTTHSMGTGGIQSNVQSTSNLSKTGVSDTGRTGATDTTHSVGTGGIPINVQSTSNLSKTGVSDTGRTGATDTTHSVGTGGIPSNVQSTSNLSKTGVSDTGRTGATDTTHSVGTGGIPSNVQSTSNLSKTGVSDTGRTGATDTTHSVGTGGTPSNVQSTSNLSKTGVSDTGRTGATDTTHSMRTGGTPSNVQSTSNLSKTGVSDTGRTGATYTTHSMGTGGTPSNVQSTSNLSKTGVSDTGRTGATYTTHSMGTGGTPSNVQSTSNLSKTGVSDTGRTGATYTTHSMGTGGTPSNVQSTSNLSKTGVSDTGRTGATYTTQSMGTGGIPSNVQSTFNLSRTGVSDTGRTGATDTTHSRGTGGNTSKLQSTSYLSKTGLSDTGRTGATDTTHSMGTGGIPGNVQSTSNLSRTGVSDTGRTGAADTARSTTYTERTVSKGTDKSTTDKRRTKQTGRHPTTTTLGGRYFSQTAVRNTNTTYNATRSTGGSNDRTNPNRGNINTPISVTSRLNGTGNRQSKTESSTGTGSTNNIGAIAGSSLWALAVLLAIAVALYRHFKNKRKVGNSFSEIGHRFNVPPKHPDFAQRRKFSPYQKLH